MDTVLEVPKSMPSTRMSATLTCRVAPLATGKAEYRKGDGYPPAAGTGDTPDHDRPTVRLPGRADPAGVRAPGRRRARRREHRRRVYPGGRARVPAHRNGHPRHG